MISFVSFMGEAVKVLDGMEQLVTNEYARTIQKMDNPQNNYHSSTVIHS